MTFWRSFDRLRAGLDRLEIDVSEPGFYDHQNFRVNEEANPEFISAYARYVASQEYSDEYLARAEPIIATIANEMAAYGAEVGHRRCLDLAMATGRMLEASGVWNYVVRGAMFVELDGDEATRKILHAFGPMDEGANVIGHVWLAAPPFTVVDVSAALQPWGAQFEGLVPHPFLATEAGEGLADVETLVDHDMILANFRRGVRITPQLLARQQEGMSELFRDFRPVEVVRNRVRLRYVPTAITACNEPFVEMGGGGGIPAYRVWNERIRPAIAHL